MDDKSLIQAFGMLGDCLGGMSINDAADRIESHETAVAAATSRLPKPKPDAREAWEALGVVFGDEVDDLFVAATLPDGWKVEPTDHSMWNAIVDSAGSKRGSYFYKGSFWDRDASLGSPLTRYVVCEYYAPYGDEPLTEAEQYERRRTVTYEIIDHVSEAQVIAFSCVVEAPAPVNSDDPNHRWFWGERDMRQRQAREQCIAWLDAHKPSWRDPGAHWPGVEE